MEACFSQLTLDVIGKAVFNYDFDALNKNTPVIQVGVCVCGGAAVCMCVLVVFWGGQRGHSGKALEQPVPGGLGLWARQSACRRVAGRLPALNRHAPS
jgi:hypothetical protein